MSQLLVEVCKVLDLQPHPNAHSLDVATVKGWETIVRKRTIKAGDFVIFIPPDSILPASLHSFLGITNYCAQLPFNYYDNFAKYRPTARRVKAARIRGVSSYGTIMTLKQFNIYITKNTSQKKKPSTLPSLIEGDNVVSQLKITKWEPPIKSTQGDVEKDHPNFIKYTDIENVRNYPETIKYYEMVRILEKIHGTLCRVGYVYDQHLKKPILTIGSKNTRRKPVDKKGHPTLYWEVLEWYPQIKECLESLYKRYQQSIILCGEIFGSEIQDLTYGLDRGIKDFRLFDIMVGNKYLNWDEVKNCCDHFNIPHPPILYIGPYSKSVVEKYTDGKTNLKPTGKFEGREGIVITPLVERTDPEVGRVIFKSVSVDYLNRQV